MRRGAWVILVGLWWWGTSGNLAVAAEVITTPEPSKEAVLNNPPAAVGVVKTIIEKLDPSYETLWTYSDGTFSQGVSASVFNFASNGVHLASVRVGYGTGEKLYGGFGLDLPGLSRRFVPQTIKGIATVKPLDVLWAIAGKYARLTPIAGYSWGENKPLYGVAFGAALTF